VEKRAFFKAKMATGNTEEALDIVQDAMFKLVEKYAGHDKDSWGALFHRILQSRIHDWYRRQSVSNRFRTWLGLDDEDGVDMIQRVEDPSSRSAEDLLQTGLTIGKLEQVLKLLSLRQQQAFLLRAWDGLDVKQTAKAMSCSEGSVKTHYSRAVQTLRHELRNEV
jgi:RNA polymerase sigma-70 factor (ECF subfamily)